MSLTGHKSMTSLAIYQKVNSDEKLRMGFTLGYSLLKTPLALPQPPQPPQLALPQPSQMQFPDIQEPIPGNIPIQQIVENRPNRH